MHRATLSIALSAVLAVGGFVLAAPSAQAAPVTVAIDTSNEAAVRAAFVNVMMPTQNAQPGWTGSDTGCVAGSPSAAADDAVLTAYNYMRAMAGQSPVTENAADSANVQQAALMIQAKMDQDGMPMNGEWNPHQRDTTWPCATPAGIGWTGGEIVSMGSPAASAIPGFMLDPGAGNQDMGHRALILLDKSSQIGIGVTNQIDVIQQTVQTAPKATQDFGWPSAGYFPYELAVWTADRWSYYPVSGSAASATVSVTKNGTPLTISSSYPVLNASGLVNTALGWTMPTLTTPKAGTVDTYHVTIDGITGGPSSTVSYDVLIFNAYEVDITSLTISGTPEVGQTLTAIAVTDPVGASKTYVWKADGTQVGTGVNYTVRPADAGKTITVTATATLANYESGTKISDPVGPVAPGTIELTDVSIQGTAEYGQTLTASATVTPTDATLAYQWSVGGTAVPGATSATYAPAVADIGKTVTVTVTATKAGFTPANRTSAATAQVTTGTLTMTPLTIDGTPRYGQTLTASTTVDPADATIAYQWSVGGVAVAGATSATYAPAIADIGKTATVTATATKAGYATGMLTSAATAQISAGVIDLPQPAIEGTAENGNTLTVTVGGVTPSDAVLTYAWTIDGTTVGTGTSYVVAPADIGKTVTVTVTAAKAGYTTVSTSSTATATVEPGAITLDTPVIAGTARVGQVLTASANVTPTDASLTYLWFADGAAIAGATGVSYTVRADDIGKAIAVRATAALNGYTTTAKTSAPTAPVTQATASVIVMYVDDDSNGALVGTPTTYQGAPGSPVTLTDAQIMAGAPTGFAWLSDDRGDVTTFGADQTVRTILVHMNHVHEAGTFTTKRTVTYVGEGLDFEPPQIVQTLDWTTDRDLATGVTAYANVTGYPALTSPVVAGYTVDVAEVPATAPVSGLTTAPTDESVTVTYTPDQVGAPGGTVNPAAPGPDTVSNTGGVVPPAPAFLGQALVGSWLLVLPLVILLQYRRRHADL